MSNTSESKSHSLTVNGISADWEICSGLVPQAQKFHLRLSLVVERRKPCSQERRKKTSSEQVIHAAELLANMTTSAEKRPRPEKVHKESKPEVSSFFSQYLIKNGKGLLANTAHYREFLHCSPEEFTSFQHWL